MYALKNTRTGHIGNNAPDMKTAKRWLKAQMRIDAMNHKYFPEYFPVLDSYEIIEVE